MRALHGLLLVVFLATPAFAGTPTSNSRLYPLSTCAVSGTALGADQVKQEHDGREIRFCSDACASTFASDTGRVMGELDRRIIEDQKPRYPLTHCVVTGEALGAQAFDLLHGNRLVRLCCAGCSSSFEKSAAEHIKRLDVAVAEQQSEAYPLEKCPIAGLDISGMKDPVEIILASRLVRLCCFGCPISLEKNPSAVLRALEAAAAETAPESTDAE